MLSSRNLAQTAKKRYFCIVMGRKIRYKEQSPTVEETRAAIARIGARMEAEKEKKRKAQERARRKAEAIELLKTIAIALSVGLFAANIIMVEWYFIFR